MTDDELRALVRDAIARHLGSRDETGPGAKGGAVTNAGPGLNPAITSATPWRAHPSFGKFLVLRNDDTGACMIEPGVQCNHCGFCQSYGH